jgi:hypothetical protein
MADTQTRILVTQFTDQLNLESQQLKSFFRGKILEAPVKGKIFEHQNLSGVDMDDIEARFEAISFGDPQHQRRGALIQSFYKALPIDNDDQLKAMVDLNSGYAKALVAGAARQIDTYIAQAAIGSILTGEQFTTSTSASSDGVATVTAGSGLTYDKVLEAVSQLQSTGAGLDGQPIYMAITDVQAQTLKSDDNVISLDYGRSDAARTGSLPMIGGAQMIVFPSSPTTGSSIINKSSSTRECFAFTADALKLGVLSDMEVRYERRPDLVDTHQMVITGRYAALRTEGAKVVKVDVTES